MIILSNDSPSNYRLTLAQSGSYLISISLQLVLVRLLVNTCICSLNDSPAGVWHVCVLVEV